LHSYGLIPEENKHEVRPLGSFPGAKSDLSRASLFLGHLRARAKDKRPPHRWLTRRSPVVGAPGGRPIAGSRDGRGITAAPLHGTA